MSDTLRERIQYILDLRGWSARELSRRAKLKSETHVGVVLHGNSAHVDTLAAIAEAAEVNFDWLSRGVGSPESSKTERAKPPVEIPDFPVALLSAIGGRQLYPATLAALRATPNEGQDEAMWRTYIELLENASNYFKMQTLMGHMCQLSPRAITAGVARDLVDFTEEKSKSKATRRRR